MTLPGEKIPNDSPESVSSDYEASYLSLSPFSAPTGNGEEIGEGGATLGTRANGG